MQFPMPWANDASFVDGFRAPCWAGPSGSSKWWMAWGPESRIQAGLQGFLGSRLLLDLESRLCAAQRIL